jgi:hypothetical protein
VRKSQHHSVQVQNQKRRHTITTFLNSRKLFTTDVPFDHPSPEKEPNTTTTSTSDTASITDTDIVDLIDNEFDLTHPASLTDSIAFESSPCPLPIIGRKNSATSSKRVPVDLNKLCMKCKLRKTNNTCSQRSCKTCCVESTACCSLIDHAREKKGARQPYSVADPSASQQVTIEFERKIREAIAIKKRIFISYKNDGICRDILPHDIDNGKEDLLIQAMDHTRNGERLFYIAKIACMEDNSW